MAALLLLHILPTGYNPIRDADHPSAAAGPAVHPVTASELAIGFATEQESRRRLTDRFRNVAEAALSARLLLLSAPSGSDRLV